jgi:hypothetical protein
MKISTNMKRMRSIGFILVTIAVLAAPPLSAEGAPEGAAQWNDPSVTIPACVAEPGTGPDAAIGENPLADAVPQALCVAQAQCSTGGPVSCSGSRCIKLDWCYAWCDGVYHWCAPPPGIYCPLVS